MKDETKIILRCQSSLKEALTQRQQNLQNSRSHKVKAESQPQNKTEKGSWDIGKNSLHGFAICSKIVKYVALGFVCPFCGRVENYETGCCPSFGETPAEQFVP